MKGLKSIFIYFVIANLFFTAPLRFLFSFLLKADFLNYSFNVINVLLIILFKRRELAGIIAKYSWIFWCFLVLILYSISFENVKVIAFFSYILIPFAFFGLYYKEALRFINNSKTTLIIVFIISACGIFYDYFYDFPWKSLSYTIGGNDVDFAKDATYNGVERIAGFLRSAFEAALTMLFLMIMILHNSKNGLVNHIIFVVTFVAIYLTTVKSCLITLLLIYLVYIAQYVNKAFQKTLIKLVYIFLCIIMIILPLGVLQDFQVPVLNNESLRDRLLNTWPFVMNEFHNWIDYILGVGIGSVGGGQLFGNQNLLNPGDNFFIFLYANLGIISCIVFYIGYARIKRIYSPLLVYMIIILFSYGITSGVVESVLGQFIIIISLFIPLNILKEENLQLAPLIKPDEQV